MVDHNHGCKQLYDWLSYTMLTQEWTQRISCKVKPYSSLFWKFFFCVPCSKYKNVNIKRNEEKCC